MYSTFASPLNASLFDVFVLQICELTLLVIEKHYNYVLRIVENKVGVSKA